MAGVLDPKKTVGTVDQPMPSVTQQTPTTAQAANGGGVLPTPSPKKNDGTGGVIGGYDDGGEVDDMPEETDGTDPQQGAAAATVDPMQAVRAALAYGRKRLGLPLNFSTGQSQQSFDDGGEVQPDQDDGAGVIQQDQPQAQSPLPDPRKTLSYLTGDGAISPDIVNALEQRVDPDGSMDPAERTLKSISAAPTPDSAFGLMQHYRTRYNAYAGGAKAALDQGNLGQAAAHATNAFAHIPTGYSIKFAPARDGMAVMAQKIGQSADPYDNMPASTNIEDRRGGTEDLGDQPSTPAYPALTPGLPHGKIPSGALIPRVSNDAPPVRSSKAVPSYDDGGEVDYSAMGDDASGDMGEQAPQEQPTILSPEQFKELLSVGYDKPIDEDAGHTIRNMVGPTPFRDAASKLMGGITSMFNKPAQPAAPQAPTTSDTQNPPDDMVSPDVAAAAEDGQPGGSPSSIGQVPPQGAKGAPAGGAPAPVAGEHNRGTADTRWNEQLARVEKLAQKLFPWASQTQQRSQYIEKMMAQHGQAEGHVMQEEAKGQSGTAMVRANAQAAHDVELNKRLDTNIAARQARDNANNLFRTFDKQQQQQVSILKSLLQTDASLARDPNAAYARVRQLAGQLGINPQDLWTAMPYFPTSGAQQGQPQGQGQGGGPSGPQRIRVNDTVYERKPNGKYRLAPEQ